MPDYISREAALSEACKGCGIDFPCEPCEPQDCEIKARLEAIPAADVVEVVHASWMAENSRPKSGIFYCSCCHRTCYDPQPTRAKGWTKRCRYHYCPNCGAKMDGGQTMPDRKRCCCNFEGWCRQWARETKWDKDGEKHE